MNPLNHVAIIMDGNGRWGLKYRNSRNVGHKEGLKTVETIIKSTIKNKIKFLTLYAFSTENWKRPKKEITYLFDLLENFLKNKIGEIHKQNIKLKIIGSITTPEPRMINVQVWDQNNVPLVDAAIKKSELGLNPQIDGQLIRLPVPELNEERRNELKKLIKSMGEKCKISIRNIRRDANEELKKLLKSKEIGEDEEKSFEKNVQNITDKHIQIVDEKVSSKEKEIMTI